MNNSSSESKFQVLVNQPSASMEPLLQEKLEDLLQMCEVDHLFITKKEFNSNPGNIKDALQNLLKDDANYKIEETEMQMALGCLSAAITHMKLLDSGHKAFELKKYTLSQYLRLDVAALTSLNVFP